MADLVTLSEAKLWLRVDGDEEDAVIAILVAAASEAVISFADGWDGESIVPDRLKLACLSRVAVAFDNRDNVNAGEGESRLLMPFRVMDV